MPFEFLLLFMLKAVLLVGTGGFFGSVARYGVKIFADKYLPLNFPYATLIVNVVGCFIIGLLFGLLERAHISNSSWLLIATGFCGAFTTFSTFALENQILFSERQTGTALLYTAISLVAGLLLCRLGISLVR